LNETEPNPIFDGALAIDGVNATELWTTTDGSQGLYMALAFAGNLSHADTVLCYYNYTG
jgi:hypothetical protein